jgi:Cytidylate kinase-like family
MAIVTISHEMGAGGSVIGMALGERLGYRDVDQDMISQAARRYGCLEERLTQLDETKPSFFERFDAETRPYVTVLQSAVLDMADLDNAVIMGRVGRCSSRGSRTCCASRATGGTGEVLQADRPAPECSIDADRLPAEVTRQEAWIIGGCQHCGTPFQVTEGVLVWVAHPAGEMSESRPRREA